MPAMLKGISFKLGLLFSGIFLVLMLLLGTLLYGVFTNVLIDYIKQDVLTRGDNHARILEEDFNRATIDHVVEWKKRSRQKCSSRFTEEKLSRLPRNPTKT